MKLQWQQRRTAGVLVHYLQSVKDYQNHMPAPHETVSCLLLQEAGNQQQQAAVPS